MQQKSLLILIISLIIALGLGVFIGSSMTKKLPQGTDKKTENTYQSGWDAAMNTMKESGAIPTLPDDVEIKSLSGTIQSISGNSITVKVADPTLLTNPNLQTRTITLDNNTKIQKYVQKNPDTIAKETAEFDEKMKSYNPESNQELPTPPMYQDTQDTTTADLKEGVQIMVSSSEDIRNKESFTATEIQIQVTPDVSPLETTGSTLPTTQSIDSASLPTPPAPIVQSQDLDTSNLPLPPTPTKTIDVKNTDKAPDTSNLPTPPSVKK